MAALVSGVHRWEHYLELSDGTIAVTQLRFREEGALQHQTFYYGVDGSPLRSTEEWIILRGVTLEQAHNFALRSGFKKV